MGLSIRSGASMEFCWKHSCGRRLPLHSAMEKALALRLRFEAIHLWVEGRDVLQYEFSATRYLP